MSLPQYVTNVTSFEDSVRILKNKGILTEADIKMIAIEKEDIEDNMDTEEETSEDDMLSNMSIGGAEISNRANPRDGFSLGFFEERLDEAVTGDLEKLEDELEKLEDKVDAKQKATIVSIIKNILRKGASKFNTSVPQGAPTNPKDPYDLGYDPTATIFETLRENKDEKSKWTNTSGKSMYDQFKEIDNLNGQEVLIGIDWEMQCNPDLSKRDIVKKVIKNLKKNPIYYTAWAMSGVEGYEPEYMSKSSNPEDWQMQYLDKNMGNVVDKKLGMQPVKGIEKAKKDSDKGGEINKTVKGVELMSLIAKTVRGMQKMDATGEKMKKISVKEGMESVDKMEVGDKVKIDPEVFPNINKPSKQVYSLPGKVNMKLDSKETYTIKKITGRDAALEDSKGNEAGYVNMSNLIKSIDENKVAKLRERLKDMIRKEIKEAAGAYGYGDAMSVKDINEVDIYGIAGNPEEEMAARMARRPMDKYEPLSITKADRDRDLDDMLKDAEYNIDSVVSQVGNDVKLGIALISRAREIKPNLVPGLRQALNLYNK
jgi:hypothetical protein